MRQSTKNKKGSIMRKEHTEFQTVGELRAFLADVPDELPICHLTNGYYTINKIGGVSGFVGELDIGHEREMRVVMRLST
jgi:hypothetical protein